MTNRTIPSKPTRYFYSNKQMKSDASGGAPLLTSSKSVGCFPTAMRDCRMVSGCRGSKKSLRGKKPPRDVSCRFMTSPPNPAICRFDDKHQRPLFTGKTHNTEARPRSRHQACEANEKITYQGVKRLVDADMPSVRIVSDDQPAKLETVSLGRGWHFPVAHLNMVEAPGDAAEVVEYIMKNDQKWPGFALRVADKLSERLDAVRTPQAKPH